MTRNINWRLSFGNEPPIQDFTAYDGERIIGRVFQVRRGMADEGRWFWTMTASAPPGAPPFVTHGHLDSRGEAGRKMVEVYEQWDAWRTKPSDWDHPRFKAGGS